MFGFSVLTIVKVVAGLALIGALVFAWRAFTGHYVAIGAARTQVKWDEDKARRIALTTAMTNLWNKKREEAEETQRKLDDERSKRTDVAQNAARNLPRNVAGLVVPGAAIRVFNDAIDRSNSAETTRASSEPAKAASAVAESADSTVGLLTQWGVTCIAAYDEARGMVTGWQSFYRGLRSAQPSVAP